MVTLTAAATIRRARSQVRSTAWLAAGCLGLLSPAAPCGAFQANPPPPPAAAPDSGVEPAANGPVPVAIPIPLAMAGSVALPVWPGLAPGETGQNLGRTYVNTDDPEYLVTDVQWPQLFYYRIKDSQTHPAVLVLPGGGYFDLAADKEGAEIARWLNTLGFDAAVLFYRVPNDRDGAYADAKQAMRVLRLRAGELGIDRSKIGVMGFSAGGHLAARLAAAPRPRYLLRDLARPDFALLIYPAYLTKSANQSTPDSVAEVQPHPGMPPMFLVQTQDDYFLSASDYAKELDAAGVKNELHMYAKGGHGYGLRAPATAPVHAWADAAAGWLRQFE